MPTREISFGRDCWNHVGYLAARMPRDHYVTEKLTAPWKSGAFLWYFDFKEKRIKRHAAKGLFSQTELNTPKTEAALSRLIERPFLQFRDRLDQLPRSRGVLEIKDWNVWRALILFALVQTARISQLRDREHAGLEKFFSFSEDDLSAMAAKHGESYAVAVVTLPAGHVLFYPEIGFFQFPIPVENQVFSNLLGRGIAVPLFPNLAFVTFPKIGNAGWLFGHRAVLERYSIGLSDDCRRVVLPPQIEIKDRDGLCERMLNVRREILREEVSRVSVYDTVRSVHKMLGIEFAD